MTHHETLLARKAEIETWFSQRERAPAVRLPDQMDETRWLDDQRVSDAEAELQRRKLAAIDTALTFAAAGLGGKCAECLKPISEKRLAAVPEAVLCCRCQEQEDGTAPATVKCSHCKRPAQPGYTKCVICRSSANKVEGGANQGFHMAKYRVGK